MAHTSRLIREMRHQVLASAQAADEPSPSLPAAAVPAEPLPARARARSYQRWVKSMLTMRLS